MRLTCFWSETNEDGCQFCAGACGICGTDASDECMHDVDERHTTLDFEDLNANEGGAKPRFVSMETISRVANSVTDEELNHMFQHYLGKLQETRKSTGGF